MTTNNTEPCSIKQNTEIDLNETGFSILYKTPIPFLDSEYYIFVMQKFS